MTLQATLTPTGLGYTYSLGDAYDPDLLTIEVSSLRQRNESWHAVLTTTTTLPGSATTPGTTHVMASEVWLLNERSRRDYADQLSSLIVAPPNATPIDFRMVLSQLTQHVLAQLEAPLAYTRLDPATVYPAPAFLLDGIIPVNHPTILYGAGGVGKSVLAAAMAVAVQTGTRWLGLEVKQAEVLYVDWETDEADIARRVQAAAAGMGLATPALRYASPVRTIEDEMAGLARIVDADKIGLVIIDSVGLAMATGRVGADQGEAAIRFFRALNGLGTATLAIDHVSGEDLRRGAAGAAKPYGSIYKWNSARNAYELRQRKEPDIHGSHLLLKHRKTNLARLQQEMPLRLNWDLGIATFSRERTGPTIVMPVDDQIMDILVTGPATPARIADLLSDDDQLVTEIDVRRALKVLIGAGKVQAAADGSIRVAKPADDVVESTLLEDET